MVSYGYPIVAFVDCQPRDHDDWAGGWVKADLGRYGTTEPCIIVAIGLGDGTFQQAAVLPPYATVDEIREAVAEGRERLAPPWRESL